VSVVDRLKEDAIRAAETKSCGNCRYRKGAGVTAECSATGTYVSTAGARGCGPKNSFPLWERKAVKKSPWWKSLF